MHLEQDYQTTPVAYITRDTNTKPSDVDLMARNDALQEISVKDHPIDAKLWPIINERIFARRPQVRLRVYEGLSEFVDLAFLQSVPDVRNLSVDCIYNSKHAEVIGDLRNLQRLHIGIRDLKNFDFLEEIPPTLKVLWIESTESKKPDISCIARFKQLEEVYIEGHSKNIAAIAELPELHTLTLRSISTPDVSYLLPLKKLRNLEFKLGGIKDFEALRQMTWIAYLEFWAVRGLDRLDAVADMTGLEVLLLQELRRLTKLPDLSRLSSLETVTLWNMKGLEDITGLVHAPALKHLALIDMGHRLAPEDWAPVLDAHRLKGVQYALGSNARNDRFAKMLEERGLNGK